MNTFLGKVDSNLEVFLFLVIPESLIQKNIMNKIINQKETKVRLLIYSKNGRYDLVEIIKRNNLTSFIEILSTIIVLCFLPSSVNNCSKHGFIIFSFTTKT